jgi:hypothetical protein
MATYGTQKVLGGTRAQRYPDPKIKGTANEFGLYQWSAFDAVLVESFKVSGAINEYSGVLDGTALGVLVFTSDIPALSRSLVDDGTTGLQKSRVAPNMLDCVATVTTSGGATVASIAQYGQVLTGYTGAAKDILVTGFPLDVVIENPGDDSAEDNVNSVFLQVVANSPVINGVIGPLLGNSALAPSPIILDSSVYTQAIKDNGNIYQLNSTAPQYQVVGIYAVDGR